jgi:hypothetical protein
MAQNFNPSNWKTTPGRAVLWLNTHTLAWKKGLQNISEHVWKQDAKSSCNQNQILKAKNDKRSKG